jgi:hypothetical protein
MILDENDNSGASETIRPTFFEPFGKANGPGFMTCIILNMAYNPVIY